jgi:NitT/TauT family transport system substrate-binding protein
MGIARRRFLQVAGGTLAASAVRLRPASSQALTPLKVGCVVLGDFGINAPTLVAIEKGFFKQNGIDAEMLPFKGGPDLLKGVLAGGADLALTGATDPLVFRERGTTIRSIATILDKNHFTLTVTPQIKRLEDLKGGTIGVTGVGSNTWVFARMLAKKMAWEPEKDIKIVGIGGIDAQAAALRRGETQGCIFGDAGAVLESQGIGRIIMRLDEVTPKWISLTAYSTDELIKGKKDAIHRGLKAIFQGHKFCRENPEDSIRIAAKGIGWSEAATKRAYEIVRPLLSVDGHIDLDAFRFMQDTLLDLGVLKKRLPLDEHYTTEFTPVKV